MPLFGATAVATLARPDDRGRLAGDGLRIRGLSEECPAFADERSRIAASDAGHADKRAGLTQRRDDGRPRPCQGYQRNG